MVIPPPGRLKSLRKDLCADSLHRLLQTTFAEVNDRRRGNTSIALSDALMSAFAMFSLKDPSLLAFDARRGDGNLNRLYGIGKVPSDTQMREVLDPVDPEELRPAFVRMFQRLQRGKVLEPYLFWKGYYLLSLDGTGYFASHQVHCGACQVKVTQDGGETTYYHQMLGAVLVHPDHPEVIPLAPEPIQKQDGSTKNDCERNAAKRLLQKLRREHPRLKLIVVEDGLASNAPHIQLLKQLHMHFILGAKPGDHEALFDQVIAADDRDQVTTMTWKEQGKTCQISFLNDISLNESHPDLHVNFLHYAEYGPDGERQKRFTWVTDLGITRRNARHFVRGGRSRWKIENETFNTLKNQGYHYEHNYGHGTQNLSVVFAMLMMLAFLVDQVQQLCCPLFQAVLKKVGSKRSLWEKVRSHYYHFAFRSMKQLHEAILYDLCKNLPVPSLDTS